MRGHAAIEGGGEYAKVTICVYIPCAEWVPGGKRRREGRKTRDLPVKKHLRDSQKMKRLTVVFGTPKRRR
jgi:hypothetical protein